MSTKVSYGPGLCGVCLQPGNVMTFTREDGILSIRCLSCFAEHVINNKVTVVGETGNVYGKPLEPKQETALVQGGKLTKLMCDRCEKMKDRSAYDVICVDCRTEVLTEVLNTVTAERHAGVVTSEDGATVEVDGLTVNW